MGRTLVWMTIAVIAVTFGDIWMSQTMKGVGEVKIGNLRELLDVAGRVLSKPKFWLAVTCMATFFFIWTGILSYADLTFVLPLTALTYILNAFLAPWFLHEEVSATRWLGVLLISAGVALVTYSEAMKKMAEAS